MLQLFGIAGWLADRFPVVHVFTAGFILWSLATIATGLLSGFESIFACRLVLGAGESLAYPCYSRLFATFIPQDHRGRANAFLDAASKLGPALGTALGGVLLLRIGWRMFFIVLGIASLLWIIPWLLMRRAWKAPKSEPEKRDSVMCLLRIRSAWGTFLGHFCGNYFWFFLLTWIPSYLVKERGMTIGRMASVVSAALIAVASATVLAGWVSDRLIARGASITTVRKSVVVTGLAGFFRHLAGCVHGEPIRSRSFCSSAPASHSALILRITGPSRKRLPVPPWQDAGQAFRMVSGISPASLRLGSRELSLRRAARLNSRLSSQHNRARRRSFLGLGCGARRTGSLERTNGVSKLSNSSEELAINELIEVSRSMFYRGYSFGTAGT